MSVESWGGVLHCMHNELLTWTLSFFCPTPPPGLPPVPCGRALVGDIPLCMSVQDWGWSYGHSMSIPD